MIRNVRVLRRNTTVRAGPVVTVMEWKIEYGASACRCNWSNRAILTTVCWVPQAVKIIRDRDTRAISLSGTMLCTLGVLLWLVYGLAIVDGPLIGSSIVTFAMTATILVLKIRHG
jgi:MtN3 and saliva related transmembrane protein